MKKHYRLQVLIEQDEDGKFIASCPSLEGCYSQGDSAEEAVNNVRDVMEMCLKEMEEENSDFNPSYPEIIEVRRLDIAV